MSAAANAGSSFRGWMQSTGQTSTHAVSFVPMHGSQMIYAIALILSQACLPELAALFTPLKPVLGQYEVCVSTEAIEAVIAGEAGTDVPARFRAIDATDPLEAFGSAGQYDRAGLARLYGGTRARVARGWKRQGDRFESITLVSPYPDATLTRLNPGTLIIRFTIISVSP